MASDKVYSDKISALPITRNSYAILKIMTGPVEVRLGDSDSKPLMQTPGEDNVRFEPSFFFL